MSMKRNFHPFSRSYCTQFRDRLLRCHFKQFVHETASVAIEVQ